MRHHERPQETEIGIQSSVLRQKLYFMVLFAFQQIKIYNWKVSELEELE